jgi:hypothetical protein
VPRAAQKLRVQRDGAREETRLERKKRAHAAAKAGMRRVRKKNAHAAVKDDLRLAAKDGLRLVVKDGLRLAAKDAPRLAVRDDLRLAAKFALVRVRMLRLVVAVIRNPLLRVGAQPSRRARRDQ